jgi:hypothetical protein
MLNMQLIMEKNSLKQAKIIKELMRYLKAKASELVESAPF